MEPPRPDPAVVCTLGSGAVRAQLGEWANLQRWYERTEAARGGVRLWFDSAAEDAVREVVATEAACCGFLRFEVLGDANLVRLEITSDRSAAQPVIARLASEASGHTSG